jgi:hypothetical protein
MQTKHPQIYANWQPSGLPLCDYLDWQLSGLSLRDYLESKDIYISVYPQTWHKRSMFYAAVVQCFSQVYYSYYEWNEIDTYEPQSFDDYRWITTTAHHTEFERIEKQISRATYEQAMEQATRMAFALIHNNNF